MVSLIAAVSDNWVIGNDNELPWELPEDLKYFRKQTINKPIIMGRKTYESIGRPLPNRTNIIVTRQEDYEAEGCIVAHTLQYAVIAAQGHSSGEIMIIGGAQIYKQALDEDIVDKMYITHVYQILDGDATFPIIDKGKWNRHQGMRQSADRFCPSYSFDIYERL